MLLFSYFLNISKQFRKCQAECRNVCYQQQYDKDCCEIYEQLFKYGFDLNASDFNTNEECCSNRWSDCSDTQVEDHHDSEVDRVHSECCTYRKKDWCKDQTGWCHIHECSNYKKDDIDQKEDDIFVAADCVSPYIYKSSITCIVLDCKQFLVYFFTIFAFFFCCFFTKFDVFHFFY